MKMINYNINFVLNVPSMMIHVFVLSDYPSFLKYYLSSASVFPSVSY